MAGQTVVLRNPEIRQLAIDLIRRAPDNAVVNVREAKRSTDQNALMWSLLSDISRAKPDGRKHPPETWKALFMHSCGYVVQFETGLNGQPFPTGFSSSNLTVPQMKDLITFIIQYGDEHGVEFKHKPMPEDLNQNAGKAA